MDRSCLFSCACCFVPRQILDSCICRRCFSGHLSWQMSQHLSTPLSVKIYWTLIYRFCAIWFSFLSISLSIALSPLLPNHSLSLQTSFPSDFQAFSRFSLHLVCFLSLIYMHFMFWNLGFGVFENFWGFSKLMSYWWNFGMGFCLNEFKISCIASHKHYNSIIMHLDVCKLIVCW